MDPCRSTGFYGQETIWPASKDFVHNIYSCVRQFQKTKLSTYDKSHCRVDDEDCIWPNDVPNIFYFSGISGKIHKYICKVQSIILVDMERNTMDLYDVYRAQSFQHFSCVLQRHHDVWPYFLIVAALSVEFLANLPYQWKLLASEMVFAV